MSSWNVLTATEDFTVASVTAPTDGGYLVLSHFRVRQRKIGEGFVKAFIRKSQWRNPTSESADGTLTRMITERMDTPVAAKEFISVGGTTAWRFQHLEAGDTLRVRYRASHEGRHDWIDDDEGRPRLVLFKLDRGCDTHQHGVAGGETAVNGALTDYPTNMEECIM